MPFGPSDTKHGEGTKPGASASKKSEREAVAALVRSGSGSVGVAAGLGGMCSIASPPRITIRTMIELAANESASSAARWPPRHFDRARWPHEPGSNAAEGAETS